MTVAENQSRQKLSETLLAFDSGIEAGDTVFFFFAGPGFEIHGQNYLLPIDVPAATEGQEELVQDAAFAVEGIIDRMQAHGARTTILVLDACRNNPFQRPGTRAVGGSGGLAPITPPEGVFILFSAGAKQTALDAMSQNDPDPDCGFHPQFRPRNGQSGTTMVQLAKRHPGRDQGAGRERPARADRRLITMRSSAILCSTPVPTAPAEHGMTAIALGGSAAPGAGAEPSAAGDPVTRPGPADQRAARPAVQESTRAWSVTMSFVDPGVAFSWRLSGETARSRDRISRHARPAHARLYGEPRNIRARPRHQPAAMIYIRAIDLSGNTAGPFPVKFEHHHQSRRPAQASLAGRSS